MAVDDIYRLTTSATGQGSVYQNVLHLRVVNENPVTAAMFASVATAWQTVWTPTQPNTVTWTGWSAIQEWGSGMAIDAPNCNRTGGQQFADVMTGNGSQTGQEMLPPQCSWVITWLTGFAGRRKRGRSYGFGLVESIQADGQWSSTAMSTMTTRLNTFIALYRYPNGTSPDFQLTVWSERTASGCVPATPPARGHVQVDVPHPELASTPVTSYTSRPTVYSQRRRTRGVGR